MNTILTKGDVTTNIDAEVIKRIKSGQGSSFLYIVSTQRTVKRLNEKFLELAGEYFLEPQIYTLKTLSEEFYRTFGSGREIISEAVQTIMIQDIIGETELEYFKPELEISVPQGTVIRLVEAINKLKTAGVNYDVLKSELNEVNNNEAKKLKDICLIYQKYEHELGKNRLIDDAGISQEIAYRLSKSQIPFKNLFPEVELVVISGYDVFSAYNFKIIDSIASIEDVDTYVALELNLSNPGLFGHLIDNYKNFINSGFREISSQDFPEGTTKMDGKACLRTKRRSGVLGSKRATKMGGKVGVLRSKRATRSYFSDNLFSESELPEKKEQSNRITLIETKTREEEVETIAKLIRRQLSKVRKVQNGRRIQNDDYSQSAIRIGITFYQLETYAALIREVFPLYNISFSMNTAYKLANSPVVTSIISLLEAVEEKFSRRNVLRVLKTPYFSFKHKDKVDTGNLYSVSANLKITSGISDWSEKINERLRTLELDNPESEEIEKVAERSRGASPEKMRLIKAQEDIEYFIRLLESLRTSLTPEEFKDNLVSIIDLLRLPQQILQLLPENEDEASNLTSSLNVEKDVKAYKKFISVLESVVDFVRLRYGEDAKHRLSFYLNILRLAISQTTFYVGGDSESEVQIVPITDMINPTVEPKYSLFDIVILGGLVDGEFPTVFYPDVFLSEKRAKTEQERLLEDRFLFYQTVVLPEKHIYLIRPKFGQEGNELVRSPFVDEVLRIAEVEETSPIKLDVVVYNEEKLLKIYGEHLWHGYKLSGLSLPKETSDKLKAVEHNIEVKMSRTEDEYELPEYNGIIFHSLNSQSQNQISKLKDYEYSISQLEDYGECPFRYFAKRILELNQLEEIEEGLSYLERGNLLHEIVYEFYSNRRDEKPIKYCNDQEFQEAVEKLLDIAKSKISQINLTGLFWDIKVERIIGEADRRKGILRTFLEEIERDSETKPLPKYFEVPFGSTVRQRFRRDEGLDLGKEVKIGNVKMQGIIDRIEIGDGFFVVADYKTGSRIPKIDDIIEGRSVQLPVYIRAIEQFWNQSEFDLKGVAGVYYQLREECKAELGLGDAEYKDIAFKASSRNGQIVPGYKVELSLDEVINITVEYLNDYVESISNGIFPLTHHDSNKVCRYCPYKRICRVSPTNVID